MAGIMNTKRWGAQIVVSTVYDVVYESATALNFSQKIVVHFDPADFGTHASQQ